MKQFNRLFRKPLYYLFPHYSRKEKFITVSLFSGIVVPMAIMMPQFGPGFYLSVPVLLLIMSFLGRILLKRVIKNNTRVCNEVYLVKIDEFTKAFGIRFRENLFIISLAFKYRKFEDLLADIDEDYTPQNPDVKKKFFAALLKICGFIAFLATFLFNDASMSTKISFLAIVAVIFIFIMMAYYQVSPLIKDIFRDRYKKDKLIIAILEKIKKEIGQFSPKYVASTELRTLIWKSSLISDDFRDYFLLKESRLKENPVRSGQ